MPNQPATPARTVRIDDEDWELAKLIAEDRGDASRSDYIRRLLREDARRWPGPSPGQKQ